MGYVLIFVDKYRTDTGLYVYTYVSIYSKVNIHNSKKKGGLQREEEREREREREKGRNAEREMEREMEVDM